MFSHGSTLCAERTASRRERGEFARDDCKLTLGGHVGYDGAVRGILEVAAGIGAVRGNLVDETGNQAVD